MSRRNIKLSVHQLLKIDWTSETVIFPYSLPSDLTDYLFFIKGEKRHTDVLTFWPVWQRRRHKSSSNIYSPSPGHEVDLYKWLSRWRSDIYYFPRVFKFLVDISGPGDLIPYCDRQWHAANLIIPSIPESHRDTWRAACIVYLARPDEATSRALHTCLIGNLLDFLLLFRSSSSFIFFM